MNKLVCKIAVSIVVICTLLFTLSISAVAVEMPTIKISSSEASADEVIEVTVSLANNPGIVSMKLQIGYDKSSLTLLEIKDAGNFSVANHNKDENLLVWEGDTLEQNITYNGTIAILRFKVNNGAKGNSTIGLSYNLNDYDIFNHDMKTVEFNVVSGVVSITCPHTNKTAVAAVPATCAAEGTKAHEECSDCGKLFLDGKEVTEAEISIPKDPANHDGETEIRNAVSATEEAEGYTGDTYCLGCNQKIKDGEKIAKLDHAHAMTHTAATVPTCTTDGVVENWTCSKCGNSYADEAGTVKLESTVDPKLGHKTELKDAKEATCTEDGYTGDEICTVCNETVKKGEAVAAKGHTVEKVDEKAATCSEDGYTGDEICTVCNETVKKGEIIPATGKHEEEVRDTKEADCTNKGYTGDTYCKLCGEKLKAGEDIPTDNTKHDYQWVVDKEPTFEETGLKHEECTRCHDKRSLDTVIEKNDCFHSTMEHHNKVAATCVATGTCEYWHCTECDRNYSDEKGTLKIEKVEDLVLPIDPNNHVNTEIRDVKSATCSSEGYTGDKYCTDCNTLIASGSILAINPDGHNFINNKCEYCGKIQVTYYPPTFTYIDDETHLAGGNIRSHVPDSLTMHTDGVYEWNYCLYCQHEYGRVPVTEADININDSVDLIVDDPVQSTNDGDDIDVDDNTDDNTDADAAEPEDNNPPTGIAIALLPMALAMAAATIVRKK